MGMLPEELQSGNWGADVSDWVEWGLEVSDWLKMGRARVLNMTPSTCKTSVLDTFVLLDTLHGSNKDGNGSSNGSISRSSQNFNNIAQESNNG